jgi:tripartite-type tricarboxylate transporter receptor subunit TctC
MQETGSTAGALFTRRRALGLSLMLGTGLAAIGCGPAAAADPVDFSGKRITLIIPYGEGGGSNFHGRLFAQALEPTLPGKPTIISRNIEGGGSIRGTNEFKKLAEPNGLMFIEIGASTLLNSVFKDPTVNYDLAKFIPFLSSPTGSIVYGRTDYAGGLTEDPIANVKKFIDNPPTIASQTITSSDLGMLVSYDLLGIKPKVVFGIGLGESRAGLERNEFQMRHDTMLSFSEEVVPLVKDGTVKLLFTLGYEKDGQIVRDPNAPDTPHFLEVYEKIKGKKLTGIEYDVWKSLFDLRVMAGKMLLLPEGTPQEIVDAYSKATADALQLPVMKDERARLILGGYPQITGPETKKILAGALALTPEHVAWIKDWASRVHNAKIR